MISKLFLFDLDWTLIYAGGAGLRALDYAFEHLFKIPKGSEGIIPDGKTDPAVFREIIHMHLGRSPTFIELGQLRRVYLHRLKTEVYRAKMYRVLPGVPKLLEILSNQSEAIIGLGTGNLEEAAHIKLDRAGLMPYFHFGGFGSDAENRIDVLRAGVKRGETVIGHSVLPRDVIVIGDNIRDIQAGKAIGATTVAVSTGPMGYKDLAAANPDHLFHDLLNTELIIKTLLPFHPG